MKFAYADPPYPGQSAKHYSDHADYAGEVDHADLISQLGSDYPDGWALSTDSGSLRWLLPLCPDKTRVMAWVKPFASWKKGVFPPYAWEPVLMHGGRNRFGQVQSMRDWVSATPPVFRGGGSDTKGEKPLEFSYWLFDSLGAMAEDEFDDLFPGSGEVTQAWQRFCTQPRLAFPSAPDQPELGVA